MLDASGRLQELIIFTEYRDTLEYLTSELGRPLGRTDAQVRVPTSIALT